MLLINIQSTTFIIGSEQIYKESASKFKRAVKHV